VTFELSFLDTMVGYTSTLRHRLTESSPIAGSFRVILRAEDVASPRKIHVSSPDAALVVYVGYSVSKLGTAPVAKA
jgi:hypothetical protein